MTRYTKATFAAAFLAASVLSGSAAFAWSGDGEYYVGVSPKPIERFNLDSFSTQSILGDTDKKMSEETPEKVPGDGEYYEGIDNDALKR